MGETRDIRAVFASEYAAHHAGEAIRLRDGDEVIIGTRYAYEDHEDVLFPTVGKTHRYATVGRWAVWALDRASVAERIDGGARVHFTDGAVCEATIDTDAHVRCSCDAGERQCRHALGAVYMAGAMLDEVPVGPHQAHRALQAAIEQSGESHEAIDVIAAADCGYVFCRALGAMHFARMIRVDDPPGPPPPSLAETLFA